MSLDRVDARFLLPTLPSRATVVGQFPTWAEGLEQAGIELSGVDSTEAPQLAIARADAIDAAIATGADLLLVEGGTATGALRRAGFHVQRFLPRPTVERPAVFIPLDQPHAARYAATHWTASTPWWRRARNSLAAHALGLGLAPSRGAVTLVATRRREPPAFVAAAASRGHEASSWLLTPGRGDELSRSVFHLFGQGSHSPDLVLKFARVTNYRAPFDRDEAGLALVRTAGSPVEGHAPRLLDRFDVEGLEASVETAARGERLTRLLARSGRAPGLELIERIAAWLISVAEATAAGPETLEAERLRLVQEVLPLWEGHGVDAALVNDLPALGAVLQHNDPGPWNIVADSSAFTLVDWESARQHGLPLWDLVYFLTEALATLDQVADQDRDEYVGRLFRGEAKSSGVLFAWIRRAVSASAIPPVAVGPLVTLCWLHHGISHRTRHRTVEALGAGSANFVPPIERTADVWLRDPGLGASWTKWRADS
ncbi:MAG: hypothetical protein QOH23_2617 [Gaiellaceae bacterium]|nr:hypothetical protein [Gaiellaceae bacterium]